MRRVPFNIYTYITRFTDITPYCSTFLTIPLYIYNIIIQNKNLKNYNLSRLFCLSMMLYFFILKLNKALNKLNSTRNRSSVNSIIIPNFMPCWWKITQKSRIAERSGLGIRKSHKDSSKILFWVQGDMGKQTFWKLNLGHFVDLPLISMGGAMIPANFIRPIEKPSTPFVWI